jgi:SAM-dependent methyltransferase
MNGGAMRQRFEQIYATNEWGCGSGEGSLPVHTHTYARFLEAFIKKHCIKSVVDLGCGDWQFSRLLDWQGATYTGFDIVSSVVEDNQRRYARKNISFQLSTASYEELIPADLLLVKDVLQHWSNKSITDFLPILDRYPFALLTNCVNPHGETTNEEIQDGEFRYLDLRLSPFHLQAQCVFTFANAEATSEHPPRWRKRVLLTERHDVVSSGS